jgi:3-hydroxyisobutyrate dehydrogenase-like beta-hydroxyacid dehydrogenase
MKSRVGVVGLGIMGSAMSENLVKAGFEVSGFDVATNRRKALRAAGGRPEGSAGDVARRAAIVVTSLPSAGALEAVSREVAASAARGGILVETSTLPIGDKQAARRLLARAGVTMLDCPLSGTGTQAKTRDLVAYASGPEAAYRRCVPVFEGFARAHRHLGPFGNGMKMKFITNLLVAIHNVAAAEALTLARKAGLDLAQVLEVVGGSAGASRMFQVRGPRMVAGDYTPMMRLTLWQKDMSIISAFARGLGCPTPLFAECVELYAATMAQGHADHDSAAVCAVMEGLAGLERRPSGRRRGRRGRRAQSSSRSS